MHHKAHKQMSEAFLTAAFLSVSGGLQDAYTYLARGNVFANAQTGNVVLMSQHFMTGDWGSGVRYLLPLLAFILGVFVADQIQIRYKYARRLHWRQGILLAEIAILFIVGFIIYGFVKDNGIQFIFMIVGFTYGIWETNRKKSYIERNVYKQVNNKK